MAAFEMKPETRESAGVMTRLITDRYIICRNLASPKWAAVIVQQTLKLVPGMQSQLVGFAALRRHPAVVPPSLAKEQD